MDNPSQNRKSIALEYLAISKREFEQAARNRIRYMQLARDYGNTHAAIGDALGISESAVRAMLLRHGEAQGDLTHVYGGVA